MLFEFILCFITLFTSGAAASERYGRSCGLVDLETELAHYEVQGARKNLESGSFIFSAAEKLQIMQAARAFADGEHKIPSVALALSDLRRLTSKGLYSTKLFVHNRRYDLIMAFPGENPVGFVFNEWSADVVATIQDSDVICL